MVRRELLTDAAIRVLAEGGGRQLTHRAVDTAAGLPQGSTSNVFRTRSALIDGVLARLVETEQAVLDALHADGIARPMRSAGLVALAAGMVADALGRGRAATLARRALFADASRDPRIARQLEDATRHWWDLVAGLLRELGVPDERNRARWLLAYLDGVISDQLARPQVDFDAADAVAPAVHGVLTYAG